MVASLKQELEGAKQEAEREKTNARLLMDYPFVKQTTEGYAEHIKSLTNSGESHRQITANTVRILLLEEQNCELREGVVPVMEAAKVHNGGRPFLVTINFSLSLSLSLSVL